MDRSLAGCCNYSEVLNEKFSVVFDDQLSHQSCLFEMLDVVAAFGIGYVEIGIPVEEPHLDGAVVRQTQEKIFPDLTKAEIVSVLAEIRSRYSFNVILMTYQSGVDSFQLDQLSQELYDAILCVDQTFDGKFAGKLVHTFTTAMGKKRLRRS